jgi:hypothetical protein
MRIIRYAGLETEGLTEQYSRTIEAIARGDFRAAQVKKLGEAPRPILRDRHT